MSPAQITIILLFSAFSGWLVSVACLRILFFKGFKNSSGSTSFPGLIAGLKPRFSLKISQTAQQEFLQYQGLEEKIADPLLLQKLKPEIEKHVDFFLREKMNVIFPLLSKLMGEKTLLQFKHAFLEEIDLLFPVIIRRYAHEFKKEINVEMIVSEKINALSIESLRDAFYENARKEIGFFKVICTATGLLCGTGAVIASLLIGR